MLTREEMVRSFRNLGLASGDSVIIHSSFRSLGECEPSSVRVDGGPRTVIEALLETIGPQGNLMLPTFNYTSPLPEPYYDPAETPCRTGIIPETGRKYPGVIRSLHPTHSVAVIGPDAMELTNDHLQFRTFGVGSPLDRLAKKGGKVLLMGVGNITNSMIHVGEEYAGTPKVSWYDPMPLIDVLMPDGSILSHPLDTSPSCSSAFGAADFALRRKGLIRDARLGGCKLQLMKGADIIECVCEMLRDKPDVLLCTWAECRPCVGARRNLRELGVVTG